MTPAPQRPRAGRLLVCFLLGAAVGTLLDGIHVYGDVLSYPDTAFGRWAWFVPVEFGVITACLGFAIPWIERAVAAAGTPHWSVVQRIVEVGLFAGLYFATTIVDGHGAWPVILAVALALLALARVLSGCSPGDWFYALAACIAGPIGEALLIEADLFSYANPDFIHIPIWLVPLWANAGLLFRRMVAPIVLDSESPRELT